MRFAIAVLFIVCSVLGLADVSRADSEPSSVAILDIRRHIKNDDDRGVTEILKKIETGQIELGPQAYILLLIATFKSATSKLHDSKHVGGALAAILYALLLVVRLVLGYFGGAVSGLLAGLLGGIGGSFNGLLKGLGGGLKHGHLLRGLERGLTGFLAGGSGRGAEDLGLGFFGGLKALISPHDL